MDTLHVGELTFQIVRSSRRRTVEIGVERDGRLVLRAPEGVSDAQLERFATQKRLWVHDKLARKRALTASLPPREFVVGEGFRYLGRSYRLLLVEEQDRPLKLLDGRFRLTRGEVSRAREHFIHWYVEHGKPWITGRAAEWMPRFGVADVRVEVLDLGFRWGSCGRGERLNFNWATITLPPGIIDYVIVHELTHLQYGHHGAPFWAQVARVIPDFETRKTWLAEHGAEHGL